MEVFGMGGVRGGLGGEGWPWCHVCFMLHGLVDFKLTFTDARGPGGVKKERGGSKGTK